MTLQHLPTRQARRDRPISRPQGRERTIAVSARSHSRFARLKIRYPGLRGSWFSRPANRYPDTTSLTCYDADLALELLDRTGELPDSKYDLVLVLTEYRNALRTLATQATGDEAAASVALADKAR